MGDREEKLLRAVNALRKLDEKLVTSSIYEAEAWGGIEQNSFLNMVVFLSTSFQISEFHSHIQAIEIAAGPKVKSHKYGPRYLDIDILFWGAEQINNHTLTVPHPRLHLRNFVLQPLYEIAPHFRHPQLDRTIEELMYASKDTLKCNPL